MKLLQEKGAELDPWFNETGRNHACVKDGMALNLLRRPLITVYPYNLSATTYFLEWERACMCVRGHTQTLYMQTSCIHVHLYIYLFAFGVHMRTLLTLMREND